MLKKICKALRNPKLILLVLLNKPFVSKLFSDKLYLKIKFRLTMGEKLNIDNPRTFNEKLQWLKLYNRKDEYTIMADKYAVRQYIADKIGEEYLIPLLGVWDNADDIDFDALPEQFVLKCNHTSGHGIIICRDKSKLDRKKTRTILNKAMKMDYSFQNKEWPYKNIKKKIIAEKYMVDEESNSFETGLTDYKFYCFNGKPKFAYVSRGLENHKTAQISFVTSNWEFAPFKRLDYKSFEKLPPKPVNLEKMLELAAVLSLEHSFLRVDFYEINHKIYFGELTFFPGTGMVPIAPKEWDYTLGSWITLPEKYN